MTLDFNKDGPRLFTPVFLKVRESKTRYTVVYGGAASGKSYAVHQRELIELMMPGTGDTLVIRKSAADLRDSCYKLFQSLIARYDLDNLFRPVYGGDHRKITCLSTGRSIIFKGISQPEKLKSIVGVKRIIIEEANQCDFEDFLELNRRARGMEGIQIILILNPVSENHWIKTQLCDEGSPYHNDTTVLKFTYKDNCNMEGTSFVTDTDIKELERLKLLNENQYRIYVLAEWGIDNKEGKFCWAFDSSQVKATKYEPDYLLWATFDFNVNPLTCSVAQVFVEAQLIRAIECIKLENSDIYKMCDRLMAAYPYAIWCVTGDASGSSRSAMVRDNITYYQIIRQQMTLTNQQIQVPTVNPPIDQNQVLVNAVHKNWTVEIDPERCKPLIFDLQYVEVDGLGKIVKGENRKGSNTHNNRRKYADFLDNWRYLMNVAVKPYFGLR